jgi:hypothetical protein
VRGLKIANPAVDLCCVFACLLVVKIINPQGISAFGLLLLLLLLLCDCLFVCLFAVNLTKPYGI